MLIKNSYRVLHGQFKKSQEIACQAKVRSKIKTVPFVLPAAGILLAAAVRSNSSETLLRGWRCHIIQEIYQAQDRIRGNKIAIKNIIRRSWDMHGSFGTWNAIVRLFIFRNVASRLQNAISTHPVWKYQNMNQEKWHQFYRVFQLFRSKEMCLWNWSCMLVLYFFIPYVPLFLS